VTFFLEQFDEPPKIKGRQPANERIPSWIEGLTAGYRTAQLENDSNFRAANTRSMVASERAARAAEALGPDRVMEELVARGLVSAGTEFRPELIKSRGRARDTVLEMAREAAQADPQAWAEIDVADEAIEREANARMQADYEDAQGILDMLPEGRFAAEFLGGMAGITADIKNLPFLLLGGGSGSFLRVMAREAAINTAAEAAFLPSQFAQAERLDIPDPDVATQLAMAAGAGAAIGGVVEAGRRGLVYWKARGRTTQPLTLDQSMAVDKVEDALAGETDNPLRDAFEVARQETLILRNPINPEREPLVPNEIEMSRLPPVDGAEPQPLPDPLLTQQAEAAIAEADSALLRDFPILRYQHPLAQQIKSIGGIQWTRINPATGEREMTWVASELMARGVTQKQALSYIRKNGSASLDNITPSQIGMEPGTGIRMSDDGLYLDRDDLVDAMAREILSGEKTPFSVEMNLRMDEIRAMGRTEPTAIDDWRAPPDHPDEFTIDLNSYLFDQGEDVAMARIAEDVTAYLKRTGDFDRLTEAERAEIIAESQRNGGSVEYLVERAYERETDFWARADEATDDIPWEDPGRRGPAPGAARPAEPDARATEPLAAEAGGPDPRAGGDAGAPRAADGQTRIPGTERVDTGQAQRDRATIAARQQQSRMGRLDQTRVEDDPGGLFGGAQRSMFDDPVSKDARVVQDTVADDLRTQIERDGDFNVMMDDGTMVPASRVLDDLDAGDRASARLDLCGMMGAPE
jgi:hypothetical protein